MDCNRVENQNEKKSSDNPTAKLNSSNNESLYRRIVEEAVDVIWTADLAGRFTYLSPQFETLFGFDPIATLGKTKSDFVHIEDHQDIVNATRNLLNGEAPANIEFRHRCSDGSYKWVMVKASLSCDSQGIAVGLQGIISDINERKIAQLALHIEQSRSRLIAESVPGMIFRHLLRANGSEALLYVGPQCKELFEVEPIDAMNDISKLVERFYDRDSELIKKRRDESAKDLSLFRLEYRVLLPQKGLCWRQSVSQPSKTINGDIVWDGIITDITDSKNAEIQLQKANEQLEKTTKLKDEFLATMSHELRTPLTAILGINEGLQQEMYGPVSRDQASSYKIIQESGQHLLDLINEVLDLAKIESGSLELVTTEIDIRRLCKSCLQILSQQAKEKNIELRSQLPVNLKPFVTDEKRVRQILVNLLNNAVKFTNSGGEILLQVQTISSLDSNSVDSVRFSVKDNGIGMDESTIDTLFEPFSQAQTSLNREYEGIGLGLALVKKFTDLLSGTVSVKSAVGRGTCFCIDLPLRQEKQLHNVLNRSESQPAQDREDYTQKLHVENKKGSEVQVLLAEDNDAVAISTTRYLELSNCQVHRVNNGQDAVNAANANTPDIILMDIQMPGVDGLECIKRIRQITTLRKTPIIAITGLAMHDDSTRCLDAGADRYISKPYRMHDLVKVIEQMVQSQPTSQSDAQSQLHSRPLSA